MITFKVYQAKAVGRGKGKWRWTAINKENGKTIADNSEGLINKDDLLSGLLNFLHDVQFQRFTVEMPPTPRCGKSKRCGPPKKSSR